MKIRFATIVVALSMITAGRPSAADCLLQFEALAAADKATVEVVAKGKVLMRLRDGTPTALRPRAQAVADKLNVAAMSGARPADVTVKLVDQQAQLLVTGTVIITVDAALAKSANSSVEGLARNWAANVRNILTEPYLALSPYSELLVPVGESRTVKWGGTAGKPDITRVGDDTVISVQDVTDGNRLAVWALQPGETKLSFGINDCSHTISVICRKWAAHVPSTSRLQVSGGGLRKENLSQAIQCLVHSVSGLEPGARLTIGGPVASAGGYQIDVKAEGAAYLPVIRTHAVQIQKIAAPEMTADTLLVSNVPEKVPGPAVLLREHISQRRGARLLWHHVNASTRPMRLVVRVHNPGDSTIPLHLTEGRAGPSGDELFAGHVATSRFISDLFSGTGYVSPIPGRSSAEISEVRLRPGELASGVKRMVPLGDGEFTVEVVADENVSASERLVTYSSMSASIDRRTSGYMYDGEKLVDMHHKVGDGWTFYSLGKDTDVSTTGNPLMGSYGVLHRINATAENPTEQQALIEVTMHPRGGIARGVFWIEGHMVETPMLDNQSERVIHKAIVPPRGRYSVRLFTMPQSGSHYPVLLTLRSRPG
jgi:hypothetical protein